MSNLLKGGYIIHREDTRVIDYNDLVAQKLQALSPEGDFVPFSGFPQVEVTGQEETGENAADEFQEGLLAEELEVIMEEEELTPEQVLENARQEAKQLLEQANTEAEMIRNEAYDISRKKGYDDGYRQGLEETEQMKAELEQRENAFMEEYNAKLESMEPELVERIADLMEYVFRVQFTTSRAMIMHILSGALGKINLSKDFNIRVCHEDAVVVRANLERLLAMLPNVNSIEVTEDTSLVKNQCFIETDGGVYDCSLDVQMERLIKDIKTLSYNP